MTTPCQTSGDGLRAVEATACALGGTPFAAAERMLLEAGGELSRAMGRAQRRVGLEWYAEIVDWVMHLVVSRGLSHATGANYADAVAEFCGWLAEAGSSPDQVTRRDVEMWQQQLFVKLRQRAQTRRLKLTAVRRWYDWREGQGKGASPARGVQGPKKERRLPRKYSKPQLKAILGSCDRSTLIGRRDYAILLFVLATGARRMEVAGLTLHQLSLKDRVGVVRFMGKGAKERMVSFSKVVVDALGAWFADRDGMPLADHDAVFIGTAGRNVGRALDRNGLDNALRRAFVRGGLKVEPGMALHTLRSTYATALYDGGTDIERIRILMGHEDIETTRMYLAITDRQLRTRLPADFLADVTGEGKKNELPKHAQLELLRRGIAV